MRHRDSVWLALLAGPLLASCASDPGAPSAVPTALEAGSGLAPLTSGTAWTPQTNLPFTRAWSVAVTARPHGAARVYLFGGFVKTPQQDLEGIRRFDVYEPTKDRWIRKGQMPAGEGRYATSGGVVMEGKIFLPGGFRGFAPLSTMLEYTILTDAWRVLPGPRPSAYGAAGVIGNQLYVLTGQSDVRGIGFLDRYDPATETWTNLPDAPHAHLAGGGAVVGGKFYVMGGISDCCSAVTGELDVYDPVTNSWSTLPPMPTPRILMAVTALDGKLYVFGGRVGDTPVTQVDVFDPATNTWSAGVPMPLAREAPAVAPVRLAPGRTVAYLMGGADPALEPVISANHLFDPTATQ